MRMIPLLAFLLISGLLLSGEDLRSMLSVSGQAVTSLDTSIALIRFGVEVEGKKADAVEGDLSHKMNALLADLKEKKVQKIERSSFSIQPEYSNQNPPEIKAYRGRGEISVSIERERAGELIAEALASGANKVNQIELKASEEALQKGRQEAIATACQRALQSAKSAFQALSLEMDEVVSVELNAQPNPPMPWRGQAVAFAAKNAPLEIEGAQEVEAQVQLKVTFKPIND